MARHIAETFVLSKIISYPFRKLQIETRSNGALKPYLYGGRHSMRIDFHVIQVFEKATLPTQAVLHASPTRIDPRVSAACLAVLTNIALIPLPAFANCTTTGTATNCDTSAPSPWTTTIGTGP